MHHGDVSVYVKNVDLIYLSKSVTIRNIRGKTAQKDRRKFLLDALKLVGIGRRDGIPKYRAVLKLGPG
jgi:hypothetical protein